MKKWRWVFISIIAIFLAFYAFAYFFVIPKAAIVSMPLKWHNVGPGLKRGEYAIYLGRPAANNNTDSNIDTWIVRDENYTFQLELHYSKDSIADRSTITYTFSNYLFYKTGVLSTKKKDEDSSGDTQL